MDSKKAYEQTNLLIPSSSLIFQDDNCGSRSLISFSDKTGASALHASQLVFDNLVNLQTTLC